MSAGTSRYTASFDYSPPAEATPAAAKVTFAVVGGDYPELIPLYQQFGDNMAQDFFEILTARGYTVRGPFRKADDITFPDKKGSDLILIPQLQLKDDASGLKWSQSIGLALLGGSGFTGSGSLVISGRVNLIVAESMSGEKMWTKSVDIPPLTVPIEETGMYRTPGVPLRELLDREDAVHSSVAKALETQYKNILARAYQYLDPEEMQVVKKQAVEIRNKKVY